jgi:hypothetical protein
MGFEILSYRFCFVVLKGRSEKICGAKIIIIEREESGGGGGGGGGGGEW